MTTKTSTETTARYICKNCGTESATGIGYAASSDYRFPAPAANCPNPHMAAR